MTSDEYIKVFVVVKLAIIQDGKNNVSDWTVCIEWKDGWLEYLNTINIYDIDIKPI